MSDWIARLVANRLNEWSGGGSAIIDTVVLDLALKVAERVRRETLTDVTLVDRVTNAVDAYIRGGGADYAELSDVIQRTLSIEDSAPAAPQEP